MFEINRVVLIGRLTEDPELRTTPSGTSVCSLRVANNAARKDTATGEWGDKPNFVTVNAFGAAAETACRYLSRGSRVGIDGRLDWREWEAQDGSRRQVVEIIADRVQFLDGKERLEDSKPSGQAERPAEEEHSSEAPAEEPVPVGAALAGEGS